LKLEVVIAGVGGQGLITLADLIAKSARRAGNDVVVAETHGLSQRGGSVVVYVRINGSAPLVSEGRGDLMLAMELIEAVRYSKFLKPGARVVANDYLVPPPLPGLEPPKREELVEFLNKNFSLELVDATKRALDMGDVRVANVILLGRALKVGAFDGFFSAEDVEEVIREAWGPGRNLEALRAA